MATATLHSVSIERQCETTTRIKKKKREERKHWEHGHESQPKTC